MEIVAVLVAIISGVGSHLRSRSGRSSTPIRSGRSSGKSRSGSMIVVVVVLIVVVIVAVLIAIVGCGSVWWW